MWEVYCKQHLGPREEKVVWVNRRHTSLQPIQMRLLCLATGCQGPKVVSGATGGARKARKGENGGGGGWGRGRGVGWVVGGGGISSNFRVQARWLLVHTHAVFATVALLWLHILFLVKIIYASAKNFSSLATEICPSFSPNLPLLLLPVLFHSSSTGTAVSQDT